MALRSLSTEITFRDNATQAIQGVDSEIDGVRDNVAGTQDNFEDLGYETGEVSYSMQGDLQDVGSATGELEHQTGGFGDTMGRVGDSVKRNWKQIAGGIGAAGVALEGLIRKQADLEIATSQVAIAMSESNDEVREMIGGLTDHTFATDEALAGAQRLIQSNIDSKEVIEELLPVFDTFSDATGKSMVQSIDAFYAAFSALDIPLTDAAEHLDTMTWLEKETRVEMSNLENVTRRFAPELKDMNVEVDDLAVMLAAMEEQGMGGTKMMQHLRPAFNEGHESIEGVHESVGLTNEVLENQTSRLAGAEGAAEDYADAANAQDTALEKLQSRLEQSVYGYGGLISELDVLSAAMSSMLPILGTVVGLKYMGAGAALTFGVAIAGVTVPVWALLGAVAAVGAGIYYLWKNWDEVIDWITDKVDTGVEWIGGAWDRLGEWMGDTWDSIVSWAKDSIGDLMEVDIPYWIGYALGAVIKWAADMKVSAMEAGSAILEGVLEFVVTLPGRLWDFLVDTTLQIIEWAPQAYSRAKEAGAQLVDGAMSIITDLPGLIWDILVDVGNYLLDIPGQWYENAKSAAGSLWEGFKSGLGKSSPSYLERAMDDIMIKAHSMRDYLSNEFDYLGRLDNTEISYHGVVEEPDERDGFFRKAGQMFSPEKAPELASAGGPSVGIGDIHVYSQSDNPREVAQEVKRTLRKEFPTEANRYFGRQRRRR